MLPVNNHQLYYNLLPDTPPVLLAFFKPGLQLVHYSLCVLIFAVFLCTDGLRLRLHLMDGGCHVVLTVHTPTHYVSSFNGVLAILGAALSR